MAERSEGVTAGLVRRPVRDAALTEALERLAPGRLEHPDAPDLYVTAVRRLPAIEARYAPFPENLDPRLRSVLTSRGVSQLYTHQAQSIAHALARRNVVVITPTASGKTLCYNAPILNAMLAGSFESRAVPVSDESAGPGPARRAPGDCARRSRPRPASRSVSSPTTATRRRMRGARSGRAHTWS